MVDLAQAAPARKAAQQEVFVGPRPFERSEQGLFFGRDREISELLSLVVSSRAVLCYAPSGAGKTSLINAGLLPRLEQEGFEVLPSMRVRGLIPEGIDQGKVPNIYMFNALLGLVGEGGSIPAELAGRSLADYLSARPHMKDEDDFPAPRVLIFDQFEELLTSYPERWQEREAFFQQVRDALQADALLRVLFVFREDFLARFEPYVRLLKPFTQARFRLPLLGPQGAHAAVTGPLRGTGKYFKEGVVADLLKELLMVRVESAQGEAVEVEGEYVEPVQLQVVCRNLWTRLPPDVQEIGLEHIEAYGNVDKALEDFYESCLAEARSRQRANERALRQWFERQLVTPAGTRGIIFRDAAHTAGLPNPVVDFLENRHLIRGEWRAGSRWYELTHDRFIEPIQGANQRWRARRQGRMIRWFAAGAASLLLALFVFALAPSSLPGEVITQTDSAATQRAFEAFQSTAVVVEGQATQAVQIAADAQARQLAAQSQLEADPQVALLLAVAANQQADTGETRSNLHNLLSRSTPIDGKFIRIFEPAIVSPRVIQRLEDHNNWVVSVAFSPDGQRFVSSSADATLILWDVATRKPAFPLMRGPTSEALSVAYSPDGSLIASGYFNGEIVLWDASSGQPHDVQLPQEHQGAVLSVAFSPDGKRLASGGADGAIRIWELPSGRRLAALRDGKASVGSVSWSPVGQYLASGSSDGTVQLWGSSDSTVQLWNSESYSEVRSFSGHRGEVRSVAWSPDGRSLASGSIIESARQSSGEVILWDVESGGAIARPLGETIQPVRTVAFYPSGAILAIGQGNGTIALWDVRSGQILGDPLKAHDRQIGGIAFSPDGQFMVSGSFDETVVLWDLSTPTRSLAFNPAGDKLAASEGAVIGLWDLSDPTYSPNFLFGHTDDVLTLGFSPDGAMLASAGQDRGVLLWDTQTGEQAGPPRAGQAGDILTLGFSPNGKYLFSGGQDGNVLFWDLEANQQQGLPLISVPEAVIAASFESGGQNLFAGTGNGILITLDMVSRESQAEALPGLQTGQRIASLAFSRDGQKVAYLREVVEDGERAHGIELSQWDGSFDPGVNPGDLDFIVVQASNGLQKDRKFEQYLELIKTTPVRGASHFFRPDLPWQEQAELFLSQVKDRGFHFYILQIDWSSIEDVKGEAFARDTEQWLKYVDERADQKILIQTYTRGYETWLKPYGDWTKWPFFIVQYFTEQDRNGSPSLPSGVNDWKMWQYTAEGEGYGLEGKNAILSVYNGTLTEMRNWLEIPAFTIYDRGSGAQVNPGGLFLDMSLNGIDFSPDGAYVAYAGGGVVSLLDASSGKEISALPLYGATLTSLRFSPDGDTLALGTNYGYIFLWDLALLDSGTDLEPYRTLACSIAGDFPQSELEQYFTTQPDQPVCPEFPR